MTGIASALLNASQQIGIAFGLAVLSSISVTVTARELPDALASLYEARSAADAEAVRQASDAIIDGYSAGLTFGAVAIVLAAVIAAVFINAAKGRAPVAGQAVTR